MQKTLKSFLIYLTIASFLTGCSHHKIPVILDPPPKEHYEVIGTVKTEIEWHGLQWLWFWWHYMPWYPAVYKVHEKKLIKEAQALDADAIIHIKELPRRAGATAEAIRFVPEKSKSES